MTNSLVATLAPDIKQVINQSQNILLHCHPNPDPDSVGSSLAMFHYLRSLGKEVTVIGGDSPKPVALGVLPGFDKIIAQNFGDTDLANFDLFIALDSGGLEQISRLAPVVFPPHLKVVVIDHHFTNPGYGQINLVDATYPATAELLVDLFGELNATITPEIAICLFVGIYYDTGGFRFRATTSRTFAAAAELAELYPQFSRVISDISDQLEPNQLYLQAEALQRIELVGKDQIAIITLPYDLLQKYPVPEDSSKSYSLPNTLIAVKGWNIGISITEKTLGQNRISFRAKEKAGFDVTKITALLGGGGHKAAAGAMVLGTNEEAKNKVIEAIYAAYPELK